MERTLGSTTYGDTKEVSVSNRWKLLAAIAIAGWIAGLMSAIVFFFVIRQDVGQALIDLRVPPPLVMQCVEVTTQTGIIRQEASFDSPIVHGVLNGRFVRIDDGSVDGEWEQVSYYHQDEGSFEGWMHRSILVNC